MYIGSEESSNEMSKYVINHFLRNFQHIDTPIRILICNFCQGKTIKPSTPRKKPLLKGEAMLKGAETFSPPHGMVIYYLEAQMPKTRAIKRSAFLIFSTLTFFNGLECLNISSYLLLLNSDIFVEE